MVCGIFYVVGLAGIFLSSLVVQLSGFFFIWLIFENVNNLSGWSFYEMSVVYGLLVLSRISPLFHLVASKVKLDAVGNVVLGIILLAKSLYELKIGFSIKTIAMLLVTMMSGTLIFASINLITCSVSFWVVNSYHLVWATYSINELALSTVSFIFWKVGIKNYTSTGS